MKLAVALVSILLLSALLYGCPQQDSPLERSRKPGNVQTQPPTDVEVTQGTPSAGGTAPTPPPASDSGGSDSGVDDDDDGE